jgi:hypothetical protein
MNRRALLLLVLLTAASATTGCDRWRPATPRVLFYSDPVMAYDGTVPLLGRLGYQIAQADPDRYHIEVYAKLDGGGSFIAMQFYGDGRMMMHAHGKHTKGGKLHRKLAREMDELVQSLRANGGVVR